MFDFNGVPVEVKSGKSRIVVTSPVGDCVSVFEDDKTFESKLKRGIWDDSFVYRVSGEKGVSLVSQPCQDHWE
jgi:hypothetical protein